MDPNNYDIHKMLGDVLITEKVLGIGFSSQVRLAKDCNTNQFYAVKIIKRPEDPSRCAIDEVTKREIDILKTITHENIVKLWKFNVTSNSIYMVFEYCNGHNLLQYLNQYNGKLPVEDCLGVLAKICDAFELLSKSKIMHRDMKPENIMFHDGTLKIVDFGFARVLEKTEPGNYTKCGTPIYMCPQILREENYSYKCDIWSTGVMMFQLFTGEHPFITSDMNPTEIKNMNWFKLLDLIMKKHIKWELFDNCPVNGIKELLVNMLQIDEKNRCSWKQVIDAKNEFLKKFGPITTNYLKPASPKSSNISQYIMEDNPGKIFTSNNENMFGMSIEEEKSASTMTCTSYENIDKQLGHLLNFLNYEKKFASSFQKIAGLFLNIGKNKTVQVDQTIGIIIFYLLCQVPMLKLKRILNMMNQTSLLRVYLLENGIFESFELEELSKTEVYEKFRLEVLEEMQGLTEIAKELECKVVKELQKKNIVNKMAFFTDFLQKINDGSFQDFTYAYDQLKLNSIQFLDHYKKELGVANFEFLITFRLLQEVREWNKVFFWDSAGRKEGREFEAYMEGLKSMQKPELLKLILSEIKG